MTTATTWVSKVTGLGVTPDYEDDVSMRIVFSNVIFISLPLVYLIFMIIDYESYLIPFQQWRFDVLIVPIVIAICFFNLWLNSIGKTTVSRALFILSWPLLLHLIPIQLLKTPVDYYLAYPFGIVFHAILVQLMFSRRKEKWFFYPIMMINIAEMMFAPAILTYFDKNQDIPTVLADDTYYLFDGILYWLLFNLVTFYVLYVIETYIKSVNRSKELIEKQTAELNALNHNLEALVSKRTSELEEQNEKLKKHAFFNAHLLRGPFCRIQGLIQLQDLTGIQPNETIEIKLRLKNSVEELDSRIREIQKLVDAESELIE